MIVIHASVVPTILLTCCSLWYCPSHISTGRRRSSSSSWECRLPWAFSSWAHRRCTSKQHSLCSRSFFSNSHWPWKSNDRKYVWKITCLHVWLNIAVLSWYDKVLNLLLLSCVWAHQSGSYFGPPVLSVVFGAGCAAAPTLQRAGDIPTGTDEDDYTPPTSRWH